jgi:DNA replication protein DnaC
VESLGDILKRLQQQSISAGDELPAEWLEAADAASNEPICPICRGAGWVRHDVPTTHHDFGRAFSCVCQRDADDNQVLARLHRFSNMGMLAAVSLDNSDPQGLAVTAEGRARFATALAAAQAYAEAPHGTLLLSGGSGTGKTHLAAAVANLLMVKGQPVFFAFVPDLLDHLRSSYGPENGLTYDELFEQVKNIPVLVLDDLGNHSGTPWAEEKLYQVLNHRYLTGLPTIITTGTAVDRLDGRLQSRLLDPRTSQVIDLGGGTRSGVTGVGAVEPELLKQMTFDAFDQAGRGSDAQGRQTLQAASTFARAFAEHPEGWLVLVGDSGCGKTHLAIAIANERLRRGEEVFFAFVPDLLDHLRYTFSPDSRITYDELFDRIKQTSLLILDDLGSQTSSAWANEKLYQVIVHRHNAKLPTIITTRAIPTGSQDPIASRLADARLVTVVPILAPDYRQQGNGRAERSREQRTR